MHLEIRDMEICEATCAEIFCENTHSDKSENTIMCWKYLTIYQYAVLF